MPRFSMKSYRRKNVGRLRIKRRKRKAYTARRNAIVEYKSLDTTVVQQAYQTHSTVSLNNGLFCLNGLIPGAGIHQRIGRKAKLV